MNRTPTTTQLSRALLVALALAPAVSSARADNRTWNNAGGGSFNTSTNWTPNFVPSSFDSATFNLAGPYEVSFTQNHQSSSLSINATGISYNLTNNAYTVPSMTIGDTAHGSLTIDSMTAIGILAGSNLRLGTAGPLMVDPGVNGTITIESGASLELDGTLTLGDSGVGDPGHGTLVLNGGAVEVADLDATSSNSTITWNSGDITVTGSASFYTGSNLVVNSGTLTAASASFESGLIANSGGTADLASSFIAGGITANTGATVNLTDGFHSVGGTISLAGGSVNFSGSSLSVPSITGGTLGWTQGAIDYSSNLSIGAGGVLGSSITLSDKSLTVNGVGNSITIESTGSLVVDRTTLGSLTANSISINSGGNFEYNAGSITVNTGNLTIGTGNLTGLSNGTSLSIGSGDHMTVTAGTTTIDNGYSLSVDGGTLKSNLLINNGTLTYNGGNIEVGSQPLIVGGGTGSGHINGAASISVGSFESIYTDSSITIDSGYSVSLTGGSLHGASGIDVDGSLTIGDGGADTTGSTTVTGNLTISGGSLSTDTLLNSGGTVTYNTGSISIFMGNLVIGETGIDAPAPVIIGTDSSITATQGTTIIDSGRTLSIEGGSLHTNTFDETSPGTLEFHSGQLSIQNDDIQIGPAGIDGPEPTVVGTGSSLIVAPSEFSSGGNISVVSGRELEISGGFVSTKSLSVAGTATFNSGALWLSDVGENLHVVDPSPGSGGISHPSGTVTINSLSEVRVIDGMITIDLGQGLHLSGGSLRTKGIQEDEIDSFTYTHGTLHLYESDLVIEAGASANDKRLLGASPLLIAGDDVQIIDEPNDFDDPLVYGNTTIKSGGSLRIHGGDFFTAGDLTIENGATLSGEDRNQAPLKAGLGGAAGSFFTPATLMTNDGVVSPGYSGFVGGGVLEYNGDYVQGALGELQIELDVFEAGMFRSPMNDQLFIGGLATLDGSLTLTFAFGYTWTAFDSFDLIVTGGGISGNFAPENISYPALPDGYSLLFNYAANGGNTLRLTVVPEPASGLLSLIAAFGVSSFLRRRSPARRYSGAAIVGWFRGLSQ